MSALLNKVTIDSIHEDNTSLLEQQKLIEYISCWAHQATLTS